MSFLIVLVKVSWVTESETNLSKEQQTIPMTAGRWAQVSIWPLYSFAKTMLNHASKRTELLPML